MRLCRQSVSMRAENDSIFSEEIDEATGRQRFRKVSIAREHPTAKNFTAEDSNGIGR